MSEPQATGPMVMVGGKETPVAAVEAGVRSAANWFFWIAVLSVINSAMVYFKSESVMALGLGVTLVLDAIGGMMRADGGGAIAQAIPMALSALCVGVFALLGWQARQLKMWPFYVGIAAYGLDALIFIVSGDWVGMGIHAFVLFMLFGGAMTLKALRRAAAAPMPPMAQPTV